MDAHGAEPPEGRRTPPCTRRARLKIAVIHNLDFDAVPEGDAALRHHEADADVVETAHLVADALSARGHEPRVLAVRDRLDTVLDEIRRCEADVVFNLVESLGGDAAQEAALPRLLERARVPFTGSPARALRRAHAKDLLRSLLTDRNVRVAPARTLTGASDLTEGIGAELRYPLFVKPARVDGSIGIDQQSVVESDAQLEDRVRWLSSRMAGPILVEEYLPGAEINVAVLFGAGQKGTLAVPTTIDFSGFPSELWPVVTYACKWQPGSPEYSATSVPLTGQLPGDVTDEAIALSKAVLRAIGCSGYGRVDLRLDRGGRPCVMDVNPNPDLHPEAGFSLAMRSRGIEYPDLVERIVLQTRARRASSRQGQRNAHPRSPAAGPRAPRRAASPGRQLR